MREVVVCLKEAPGETNPEILAFRKELEERTDVNVFRYTRVEQLREHLEGVCGEWAQSLAALGSPALGAS